MTVSAATTWRSVAEHRALAALLCVALPVEIASAANLVLRVGIVDSAGGGALGIGGAFAAMSLAFAVAVIPAGVLVDRTPARATFAVALALRALPMLIGGALALSGTVSTTLVLALAAGDGLAMALLRPSWQHFQASLVPARAARDAAVLDDWIARVGALGGALAGGVAVATGHTGVALILCATGFLPLLAALTLGLGAGLPQPMSGSGSLGDAWSALWGVRRLTQATRADIVLALALPVGVLAPAITVALSAVEYLGLIALAAGLGALAGASWVTLVWHRVCPARLLRQAAGLLAGILAVEAVAMGSGAVAPTPGWLVAGCLTVALAEAATSAMFTVTGSIVQADAPEGVRGGVTGLAQAPKHVATFLSATAVGATMAWAGPAVSVGIVAAAMVVAVWWLDGFDGVTSAPTPGKDAWPAAWSREVPRRIRRQRRPSRVASPSIISRRQPEVERCIQARGSQRRRCSSRSDSAWPSVSSPQRRRDTPRPGMTSPTSTEPNARPIRHMTPPPGSARLPWSPMTRRQLLTSRTSTEPNV